MLLESKKETGKQNLTVVCAAVISCRVIISIQNESWRREHTLKRMQYHLFLERLMEHWEASSPKRNAPADFSISPSKLQRISIEFHNYSKPLSEEPATSGEPISTGEPTIPDICPSLDNKDADQDNHKSETLTNKRLKKLKVKVKSQWKPKISF